MGAVGEQAGDEPVHGHGTGEAGETRHATLRDGAASLTATARRAEFTYHGRAAGEGA